MSAESAIKYSTNGTQKKILYPFQEAGVQFACSRQHSGNADDMGLGKTLQAIETINRVKPENTLIICPATIKINWKRELEDSLREPQTIGIVNGSAWVDERITIINYDILARHIDALHDKHWDFIVVDEAHYIKNLEAARSMAVLGLPADRKLWLTGSPVLNRPIELLPLLYYIGAISDKKFKQFHLRYCNAQLRSVRAKGKNGKTFFRKYWDLGGQSNIEELAREFAPWIIRRTKEEVLPDLPKKTRQLVELGGSNNGILDEWIGRFKRAGEGAGTAGEYAAALQVFECEINLEFGDFSSTRHADAMSKLPLVVSFLRDAVDASGKIVVFAHHRDFIRGLQEAFPKTSVTVMGGMDTVRKQAAVDRFVSDAGIRVFIGNIAAAGVGIDGLQKVSSHAIFAELDWSPKIVEQAEDRLCRIGQTKPVLIQHLVADGTMDVLLAKVLLGKMWLMERMGV